MKTKASKTAASKTAPIPAPVRPEKVMHMNGRGKCRMRLRTDVTR